MKKILLSFLLLFTALAINAQNNESPLWLRYCKISPDGSQIAFCYKGNIYKVPSKGGNAVQLTTHPAYDTKPVWSPDGKTIAFASNREGSFDIYLIAATGGSPKRLTMHSAHEYPVAFRNANSLLYSASIMQDVADGEFPSDLFAQTYEISTSGGRATLFSSLVMEDISFDQSGKKILYHDKKGYEDPWRKHHVSSITRDIWLCNLEGERTYQRLTSFRGEDRNPIWAANNQSFYFLSEADGTFNVYKKAFNSSTATQITNFKNHPVRFLSSSNDDMLCFAYNGEIYTTKDGAEAKKLDITIITDNQENKLNHINFFSGAREIAVSPNGKEIAFIVRGDVFVSSVEYGTTQRITNTPEQERNVSFSPDGRSVLYAAERNGSWNIYQTNLVRKEDNLFVYARELKEEQLTNTTEASFQPLYSPNGKEIAYLENRTTIKVLKLDNKKTYVVLDGKYNYSYSDGDQWFQWSPDGEWILTQYIGVGGWNNTDVALVKADGSGELTNLTESGYSDSSPRFVQGGKAMLWFSDRAGYRSHGSWGSHRDAYIMFFDRDAYDKFRMSKEELALLEEEKKNDKKEKKKDEKEKKEEVKDSIAIASNKVAPIKPIKLNLEHRRDLILRLTPNSSSLIDALLNKKGDKLYYITSFEKDFDLWVYDIKERSSKILIKGAGAGRLQTDKAEKDIFLLGGGQIKKINPETGKLTPIKINAQFDYQPQEERGYIFEHTWKLIKDKFYVTDLHNVNWDEYKKDYARFLPHINNNFDFADLLSEFLGELNASHTGARYRNSGATRPTAVLGAFFDNEYKGDGIKIKEIIEQGPLRKGSSKLDVGTIIVKIDGKTINKDEDYYHLLAGKAGKRVLLSFKPSGSGSEIEEWVKPISHGEQNNLLYKRWVEQRRQMTEKLSNGRLGYVHVRGMNSHSFREVYSELLGRCRNKEAVIIDTRHNGGGWLHDDLVTLLSGKEYQRFVPRGQYIGSDPFNKWLKPSVVLVCEDNYSNAHGFPWLYKELGIGKLIGTPIPGTMTAVWWESQIDPSLVFGVPQVAIKDMRGEYLENQELKPDIEVYNDPASVLKGRDMQLERAVQELLKDKK